MPSLIKNRENQWLARVVVEGKQVACRVFPAGEKYGDSWQSAKQWETEQRSIVKAQLKISSVKSKPLVKDLSKAPTLEVNSLQATLMTQMATLTSALQVTNLKENMDTMKKKKTLMDSKKLTIWGTKYLKHAERTMSKKTFAEKKLVLRDFMNFCNKQKITAIEDITKVQAYTFLSEINDARGGNVANKYRKNMLAAWNFGVDFVTSFPQQVAPFLAVKPFPVERHDRYVPPEEDIIKVLQQATGQDLVLLLTLYYTGARVGEIFRLTWKDVNFDEKKIRLIDHKTGNGQARVRFLQMHPELEKALCWWHINRPVKVENVFMQIQCSISMGKPFTQRMHFMKRICDKAKVKHFGFHAIRHKSAAITFVESGINAAQVLMGHYRATTTDRYIRSAGLYTSQQDILDALGGSNIGKVASELLAQNALDEFRISGMQTSFTEQKQNDVQNISEETYHEIQNIVIEFSADEI